MKTSWRLSKLIYDEILFKILSHLLKYLLRHYVVAKLKLYEVSFQIS
jgi:hypothetical protein